ncbi:MAG: hypothetical protein K6E10_12445 [Eubacterium sp.]|nr:hypothetical protein [Eubacterium sp.]
MIPGLTFKENVEEEKTKISEMTKEEKKQYFKDYYLKKCIVALVALILLIWFIVDISGNFKHRLYTGGFVNSELSEEGQAYLNEEYMESLEISGMTNRVDLAPAIFLDKEDAQTFTVFQAELAVNSYNFIVTDKMGLDFILAKECAADLDQVLDEELKNKVGDKLVFGKLGESNTEIKAAIDISDTAFVKEYIKSGDKVYFVLTGKEEEYELGIDVLKYILDKN